MYISYARAEDMSDHNEWCESAPNHDPAQSASNTNLCHLLISFAGSITSSSMAGSALDADWGVKRLADLQRKLQHVRRVFNGYRGLDSLKIVRRHCSSPICEELSCFQSYHARMLSLFLHYVDMGGSRYEAYSPWLTSARSLRLSAAIVPLHQESWHLDRIFRPQLVFRS